MDLQATNSNFCGTGEGFVLPPGLQVIWVGFAPGTKELQVQKVPVCSSSDFCNCLGGSAVMAPQKNLWISLPNKYPESGVLEEHENGGHNR